LFDIVFIGYRFLDEIVPFRGARMIAPGSAVLCGAMAAARVGKKVAVITKMAEKDRHILEPLTRLGVTTFVIPSETTTYMKVLYKSENVDERELIQVKNAGLFEIAEIPGFRSTYVHLAGISDREFTLEFVESMKRAGHTLTLDIQSFVRQVDPVTGRIAFQDVPSKKEIFRHGSMIKSDIVEAEILTGSADMEVAATTLEAWGSEETLVTSATRILVRAEHKTYFEKLTNRSVVGRTGRGDTTFGGYLAWRMDHEIAGSLRFASAIASIKMETPGPFSGTLDDVLTRMEAGI